MKRDPLKPANANRGEPVLVLQAAKLALNGSAAQIRKLQLRGGSFCDLPGDFTRGIGRTRVRFRVYDPRVAADRSTAIGHYSAADVGRLAGVSARRIGSWSRYGIIPRVSTKPKVYSYADAGEAVLVRYLLDQKVPTKQIREIVENLREEYGQWPLAAAPLEHAGPFVVVREGDRIFFSALNAEQKVIAGTLIDLQAVRDALSQGGWAAYKHPREHIEVDPNLHSGQPVVRGRRLPTETVAEIANEKDGWRILREDYGLSEAEIRDALAYEDDVAALVA